MKAAPPFANDDSRTMNSSHTTHATGSEKLKAHAAMLLFALLISGSFTLGGLAANVMPGSAINALRYILAIGVMAAFGIVVLKVPLGLPVKPWRFLILGALMAVYMFTMFKALEFTNPVSTGAVFTLMPLMSAGFAWMILGQHTRPGVLTSLVLAAAGAVWVIFRGNIDAIIAFDVGRGELIYFLGVICHAAYAPLIRKFNRGEPPYAFAFWGVAFTCLLLLIPGVPALKETGITQLPAIGWVTVVYLAVVTTAITFLLLQYASMRLPSSKVLAYGYLTPSFIIVLEGLIGHGWVSASVFVGALVTACGLVVMALLPD
jgi:drug/metabolite transporter (DMT)-like permease